MATGGEGDTSVSLKEALVESLAAILSHELHIRNAGEEHLKTLEVTEGSELLSGTLIPLSCAGSVENIKCAHGA